MRNGAAAFVVGGGPGEGKGLFLGACQRFRMALLVGGDSNRVAREACRQISRERALKWDGEIKEPPLTRM